VSFRSAPFNFPVPGKNAYLSGTWKLKLAKPKVEGKLTVGSISKKRGLYQGDSLVPIYYLPVVHSVYLAESCGCFGPTLREIWWKKSRVENLLLCVVCVVCACVCVLCVSDMYPQRCTHTPEYMHMHILMQILIYVEVWNIMVFNSNQNVPDPTNMSNPPTLWERGRVAYRIPGNIL